MAPPLSPESDLRAGGFLAAAGGPSGRSAEDVRECRCGGARATGGGADAAASGSRRRSADDFRDCRGGGARATDGGAVCCSFGLRARFGPLGGSGGGAICCLGDGPGVGLGGCGAGAARRTGPGARSCGDKELARIDPNEQQLRAIKFKSPTRFLARSPTRLSLVPRPSLQSSGGRTRFVEREPMPQVKRAGKGAQTAVCTRSNRGPVTRNTESSRRTVTVTGRKAFCARIARQRKRSASAGPK